MPLNFNTLLLSLHIALLALNATAQELPKLLQLEQQAAEAAILEASKSVVQLETFGGLERIAGELVAEGPTTGTIISSDGWIVSSLFSFRQQPASILASLPNGDRVAARIIARDFSRELALLKVDPPEPLIASVPVPKTEIDNRRVGSWCAALGKTYSKETASRSMGIVSAVGRAYGRAVQTDAKVSPVNYGGPLIDLSGRTIGILAPISPGSFFEGDSSDLYDSGIGFAIPLVDILERLPTLKQGDDIRPGKLGIVTSSQNELSGPVQVVGAMPGSPAAKSGVREGDLLIAAAGKPVSILGDLKQALGPVDSGQPFEFSVERDGEISNLECKLTQEIPVYRKRFLGLRLNATDKTGIEVVGIEPNSPASKSDLEVGNRLLKYNGSTIQSVADFAKQLSLAELDAPIQLTTVADGTEALVEVQAIEWPNEIPLSIPAVKQTVDQSLNPTIVDINVGDFPNKAFAIVPPQADQRTLGLLVLFPEPGDLSRERTQTHWEKFSRDYGWIVAVINSGNPDAWSREELQLGARVIGRMEKGYQIEPNKVVLGGLGIGGRVALLAANMQPEKINGVILLGTKLESFKTAARNTPLKSLDYLMVGDPEAFTSSAEQLKKGGYASVVLPAPNYKAQQWEGLPQLEIESWLEGLGRY